MTRWEPEHVRHTAALLSRWEDLQALRAMARSPKSRVTVEVTGIGCKRAEIPSDRLVPVLEKMMLELEQQLHDAGVNMDLLAP